MSQWVHRKSSFSEQSVSGSVLENGNISFLHYIVYLTNFGIGTQDSKIICAFTGSKSTTTLPNKEL